MNQSCLKERVSSFVKGNNDLRIVNDNLLGIEYDGMITPLFRRIYELVDDDDLCPCFDDYYRSPYYTKCVTDPTDCTCHENKRVNVTQCIISIRGDARNFEPHEAVYIVKVLTGDSDSHTIRCGLESIDTPVCEFSIMDSLNTWDENPHVPLVQKYLRLCTDAQIFRTFRGSKSAKSYILAFDALVGKILESAEQPVSILEPKPNPHIGKKKKNKVQPEIGL